MLTSLLLTTNERLSHVKVDLEGCDVFDRGINVIKMRVGGNSSNSVGIVLL